MKTSEIIVSSSGAGMNAALDLADRTAAELGLSRRDAVRMRLLAEEMMSMVRSIVGALEGKFWIEADDRAYRLRFKTTTLLDAGQRTQLIGASSSGKNQAHRGIMGKLRAFFEPMPIEETPAYLADAIVTTGKDGDITWSLDAYRERLKNSKDADGAQEEWDELEKSVVSHIADDIQVSIRGYDVELTIIKKL